MTTQTRQSARDKLNPKQISKTSIRSLSTSFHSLVPSMYLLKGGIRLVD